MQQVGMQMQAGGMMPQQAGVMPQAAGGAGVMPQAAGGAGVMPQAGAAMAQGGEMMPGQIGQEGAQGGAMAMGDDMTNDPNLIQEIQAGGMYGNQRQRSHLEHVKVLFVSLNFTHVCPGFLKAC